MKMKKVSQVVVGVVMVFSLALPVSLGNFGNAAVGEVQAAAALSPQLMEKLDQFTSHEKGLLEKYFSENIALGQLNDELCVKISDNLLTKTKPPKRTYFAEFLGMIPPEAVPFWELPSGVLLSSEYVTIIVLRFCHPLSICTLKGLRHGWFGPGLV